MSLYHQKWLRKMNLKIPTPLKKKKKQLKFEQLHTSDLFAFRIVLILKSHMKTQQAYFFKWRL